MTDPELSLEEFAQLVSGPNRFVLDWVEGVLDDRVEEAWAALGAEFRLCLLQMWVHGDVAEAERDQLVERLLLGREDDQVFLDARTALIRSVRDSFGDGPFDDLGVGARPRPIGPELELVRLFHTTGLAVNGIGHHYLVPGESARAIGVIVARVGEGWEVAGLGHHLLRPGWPPTRVQVD